MNALLLPGNSARHAKWVEDLKAALSSHFKTITTQHYRHWQTGEPWANVDDEMNVATKQVAGLGSYIIIGKSIGTVIATQATAKGYLQPKKIILLGVPINGGADSKLFAQWLQQITIPITIIQNTDDPLGSFADVKAVFENSTRNIVFIEHAGNTHDYLDFDAIVNLI